MSINQNPQTTFSFNLPVGLIDETGATHKQGVMRKATGMDEFVLWRNPQSSDNPSYGVLVILSRTIIQLGNLTNITVELLEQLFLPDLHYLLEFYNAIAPKEVQLSLSGE